MTTKQVRPTDPTDVGSFAAPFAVVVFGLIAGLVGIDLVADYLSGTEASHLVTEAAVMVLALTGAGALWRQLRSARREAGRLSLDLEAARKEAERFRAEAPGAPRSIPWRTEDGTAAPRRSRVTRPIVRNCHPSAPPRRSSVAIVPGPSSDGPRLSKLPGRRTAARVTHVAVLAIC